jgi:Protein of unknown function (DUF3987)
VTTPLENLLGKLPDARKCGKGWSAHCPAHDDRKASLSIAEGDDGNVLVNCHAGCDTPAVLAAVGLTLADLFPPKSGPAPGRSGAPKTGGRLFPTADASVADLERRHGPRSSSWTYHDARGELRGRKAEQDGFIDRILFSYPPEPPAAAEDWRYVSEQARDGWRDLWYRLRQLSMVPGDGGTLRPFMLRLSTEGRKEWHQFTADHACDLNRPDFPDYLRGPWSKLRGYAGRLALIVHCLRWAAGEIGSDTADIDGESVARAVALVDYFKGHARRVYAAMDADPAVKLARRLLKRLAQHEGFAFTHRDAYRWLRGPGVSKTADVDPALHLLERLGYVRPAPSADRPGPGRKPSETFEVNPRWYRGRIGQNGRN